MTVPDLPADWYPDPAGSGGRRWWDGTQWTSHVRAAEPPRHAATDPAAPLQTPLGLPPAAAVSDAPVLPAAPALPAVPAAPQSRPASAEPVPVPGNFAPIFQASDTANRTPYLSMTQSRSLASFESTPTVVYTSASWWLALSPVWMSVVIFMLDTALPGSMIRSIVLLTFLFVSAGLTMHDRKVLLQSGYRTAASTWWWLLTPLAYFIARGVHVNRVIGRGWATAIVYGCAAGLAFLVQLLIILVTVQSLLRAGVPV
ncbi:DUF2510 domain-containing protein [Parafrigoribacterium soli]|uniref:DUF2510 domain-containing protein n=1 Tax=Parafrigoribacterium soli TaxID=3144663 RepID=UPI0032EB0467